MVFALLTADAIFLFQDGSIQKILPEEKDIYRFSILNEEAYDRLGPPLSAEDIDQLIEKKELESTIFSDRYMLSEDDYEEFKGNLTAAYKLLEQKRSKPTHHMPVTPDYPDCANIKGYLFESIWYQIERME